MKSTSLTYKRDMTRPFRWRSHIEISWLNGATPETWTDTDITTATVTREVDPLARKLPTETITFGIIDKAHDYDPSNPNGKWERMDEGKEIAVRFGFDDAGGNTEWLDYDGYLLDGRPTYSNGIATFRASSRLTHLNKTTFYRVTLANPAPLASMAEIVLQDAGLSSSDYDVSAMPTLYTNTAAFPLASHAAILQMIAHAAGCALFTRGTKIYIAPVDIQNLTYHTWPMTRADIALGTHQADKSEPLQKVVVKAYAYDSEASSTELANVTVTINGTETVHIEHPAATGLSHTVTGGTLVSISEYVNATDLTVTASGDVTIVLTGKKITSSSTDYEWAGDSDPTHAIDTENNPLITYKATQLGSKVAAYFSHRVADSLTYRGDPAIEPLDGLYLYTGDTEVYPVIVVKTMLRFNGALTGTMTCRRVRNTIARSALWDSGPTMVHDSNGETVTVISEGYYHSDYTMAQMDDFIEAVLGE